MIKYNFIRIITFISVMLLFFAQSVYDPAVQARMRTLEDDELSNVNGEAVFIDFNVTVRGVANSVSLGNGTSPDPGYDYIKLGSMVIGNGVNPAGSFALNSTMAWDVGYSGSQAWLASTFWFPADGGMGLIANDLTVSINGGANMWLGPNVVISGLYFGRNVTSVAPQSIPGGTAVLIIGADDTRGIEWRSKISGYVDKIRYNYNTGLASLSLTGLYIYGLGNDTANLNNPGAWTARTGQMMLGGSFPNLGGTGTVECLTGLDVGQSTVGVNNQRIFVNMPMAGSIRVRDFSMGGTSFGPLVIEDAVFFKQMITFHPNL